MEGMELYKYKCSVCGFTHQVPAYWVSFQAETTYEFPHMSFQTKEMCENMMLELYTSTQT